MGKKERKEPGNEAIDNGQVIARSMPNICATKRRRKSIYRPATTITSRVEPSAAGESGILSSAQHMEDEKNIDPYQG